MACKTSQKHHSHAVQEAGMLLQSSRAADFILKLRSQNQRGRHSDQWKSRPIFGNGT